MAGIRWQGEELRASQFGDSEFMAGCESIGRFSRPSLLRIWSAYTDNKILTTGNRRSGEPAWHHPCGNVLIGILELGNMSPDSVIADLMHDTKEDSPIFQGHRNLVGEFEALTPFDMLAARYGITVAKIVLCLSKPPPPLPIGEMPKAMEDRYFRWAYNRVLNLYPEVRTLAAQAKIRDRIFNIRTESNPERLARQILETIIYILPMAKYAGGIYEELLRREIEQRTELLSSDQRVLAKGTVAYTLEAVSE